MMQIQRALVFSVLFLACLAARPGVAAAQRVDETDDERAARLARRGAGLRAGAWFVDVASADGAAKSPSFEGYFQRGLDQHLTLESSVSVWWAKTISEQALPLGGSQTVETRSFVIPLLSSLKLFPFTDVSSRFEPYLLAGIGFALGIEDESENAIGGSGTSLVTGFGFRGGAGVELHISNAVGLAAGVKYQWMHFGDEMGGKATYDGLGVDGGITYRFQF
jgi:opacity protein-like surface antigen